MNTAYLILGTNKGDKPRNLLQAVDLIASNAGAVIKKSDIFLTAPWGNTNQPDFYNQAICIQTSLSAATLLKELLAVEQLLGRKRTGEKWAERTMDIDILFYNDEIINDPDLKIPHPFMSERKFVLAPMAQLAPDFIHPVLKKNIRTMLAACIDKLEVVKQ